jgi:hypothetical protein
MGGRRVVPNGAGGPDYWRGWSKWGLAVSFLAEMRIFIDDLPSVSASRMRALGEIRAEDRATTVSRGGVEFTVALALMRFRNKGSWSYFICWCGRWCRVLRLHGDELGCMRCLRAKGLRYRVEDMSRRKRAEHAIRQLKPRLDSPMPARLKPHLRYSKLERRPRLEAAFRRAQHIVAKHGGF